MSLMDMLNKGVKIADDALKEKSQEIEEYKRRYERYDDQHLKKIFRESNGNKKLAIGMLLKERGY